MQITGQITTITPKEIVGQKQTEKQIIVVKELLGEYPNSLAIDVMGKNIEKIKNYKEWDIVQVTYNTSTSEYNGRIYNRISLWAINSQSTVEAMEDTGDDLPF